MSSIGESNEKKKKKRKADRIGEAQEPGLGKRRLLGNSDLSTYIRSTEQKS